ncbi:hypothetical protein SO802_004256 [Lithocarpus litseifolius]|uniref:Uncharacterized protein n=1 Tax=Lithocarpus litseifolius TaxID=425828 RepID=A0AAW2E2Z8_9ROSI
MPLFNDSLHTSRCQITTPFSYLHKSELASTLPCPHLLTHAVIDRSSVNRHPDLRKTLAQLHRLSEVCGGDGFVEALMKWGFGKWGFGFDGGGGGMPVGFQDPSPVDRFGRDPFGYFRSLGVKKYHASSLINL